MYVSSLAFSAEPSSLKRTNAFTVVLFGWICLLMTEN